jgi:predicted ABC-type ATPase
MLPEMLDCKEFINADEIARGLSPFQPENVSINAGRIMVERMEGLLARKSDFALETTLATKTYVKFIKHAQDEGYFVTLLYFWLNSPDLAVSRVADRVRSGGHNVPEDVIRRRYKSGIHNLFSLYTPISDYWIVIDNSEVPFKLIVEGKRGEITEMHNPVIYDLIRNS